MAGATGSEGWASEALMAIRRDSEAIEVLEPLPRERSASEETHAPASSPTVKELVVATAAWNAGDAARALGMLRAAVDRGLAGGQHHRLLAWMTFQSGHPRDASHAAAEALRLASDDPGCIALAGVIAIANRDKEGSAAAASELERVLPGSVKAQELAGHVALSVGR